MHDHHTPPSDEKAWEESYRSRQSMWSGAANPQLVAEVSDMAPRTAVDAGCGEGADAIWLARRGWRVTGIDFSDTALRRAAANTVTVDPELSTRITWQHRDLSNWRPERQYDLVTSHFMHVPTAIREPLFTTLTSAVAPGGTLLIVGHHPSDMRLQSVRPDAADWYFTAEEIASTLDPAEWSIVVAESRDRTFVRDGQEYEVADTVLRAERKL